MKSALYYECHVTIEPLTGPALDNLKSTAKTFGFRVADLLMVKADGSTEKSSRDSFCTTRGELYEDVVKRMLGLIAVLHFDGVKIRRYKIEDTLLDSRRTGIGGTEDPLGLL